MLEESEVNKCFKIEKDDRYIARAHTYVKKSPTVKSKYNK